MFVKVKVDAQEKKQSNTPLRRLHCRLSLLSRHLSHPGGGEKLFNLLKKGDTDDKLPNFGLGYLSLFDRDRVFFIFSRAGNVLKALRAFRH